MTNRQRWTGMWGCALLCCWGSAALGFVPDDRWTTTASGFTGSPGDPMTLTWSFVPDGTLIPDEGVGSGLIGFFDSQFGAGPGGSDLTARPWFRFFSESFGRWGELGGVTYAYEPRDDGSRHGFSSGVLGVRGDIRIGGASIDGAGNVLAYNQLPNGGDMVLDISDIAFLTNPSSDYLRLRNVIMHEHGHGLGILHVESNSDFLLMEPFINTAIDGPQLDEVRAIQFFYGDANEKSHGGLGNDTAARATPLGTLTPATPLSVGSDANVPSQRIEPSQVDFVSIDRVTDVDFYSFTLLEPSVLEATLFPRGGVFRQGGEGQTPVEFDANARGDLVLEILGSDGSTRIAWSNALPAGGIERISDIALDEPGQYFARVASLTDTVQLYQLDLHLTASLTSPLGADFDNNGLVNSEDLQIWVAAAPGGHEADADGDGDSDGFDLLLWQQEFGSSVASSSSLATVPEPGSWGLGAWGWCLALGWRWRALAL